MLIADLLVTSTLEMSSGWRAKNEGCKGRKRRILRRKQRSALSSQRPIQAKHHLNKYFVRTTSASQLRKRPNLGEWTSSFTDSNKPYSERWRRPRLSSYQARRRRSVRSETTSATTLNHLMRANTWYHQGSRIHPLCLITWGYLTPMMSSMNGSMVVTKHRSWSQLTEDMVSKNTLTKIAGHPT